MAPGFVSGNCDSYVAHYSVPDLVIEKESGLSKLICVSVSGVNAKTAQLQYLMIRQTQALI